MDVRLRTTRTLKVTEVKISEEERAELAELYKDARYNSLLNVMERACIEVETAHLNTSVGQPEEILGGHSVTKAAWLFFLYVQKQVLSAYNSRAATEEPEESPTLNDYLQGVE
jgi:hypothetical protein